MGVDSGTLYKLMILFMLNKVNFPLTNKQFSDFFLTKNYTTYFSLQEALSELTDSSFINTDILRNTTYYHILPKGEETLEFLTNQIPSGIVDDMNTYLTENNFELRNTVGTQADFYKATTNDYIVHCTIKEGKSTLIELNVAVPYPADASRMCANWESESQNIYEYIMKQLNK